MSKIKTFWPFLITIPTMVLCGSIVILAIVGCGDNAEVSVGKNMDSLAKIGNIYTEVDGPLANLDNKFNISKLADLSKKVSVIFEGIKQIKELRQTNNTGFMSGGAPWLLAVISIILYMQKHVQNKKTTKELKKSRDTTIGLEDTLRTMATEKKEANVQCLIDKIRNGDKNEEEQKQGQSKRTEERE